MGNEPLRLLLADDDKDDCLFFKEALEELTLPASLTMVHDGEQLMHMMSSAEKNQLPHVIFLDLNIPRKNGFECLSEIKINPKLKNLFVIMYTTSSEQGIINMLYKGGANYYIRKPAEFAQLKKVILQAYVTISENLMASAAGNWVPAMKEKFVIAGDLPPLAA